MTTGRSAVMLCSWVVKVGMTEQIPQRQFTDTSEYIHFCGFYFFVLHFLVVGSVLSINPLTHVSF